MSRTSRSSERNSNATDPLLNQLSKASIKNEVAFMTDVILRERDTSSVTIAIAREESLTALKRNCKPVKRRMSVFRGSAPSENPPV